MIYRWASKNRLQVILAVWSLMIAISMNAWTREILKQWKQSQSTLQTASSLWWTTELMGNTLHPLGFIHLSTNCHPTSFSSLSRCVVSSHKTISQLKSMLSLEFPVVQQAWALNCPKVYRVKERNTRIRRIKQFGKSKSSKEAKNISS